MQRAGSAHFEPSFLIACEWLNYSVDIGRVGQECGTGFRIGRIQGLSIAPVDIGRLEVNR